jgi:hypothetical protein
LKPPEAEAEFGGTADDEIAAAAAVEEEEAGIAEQALTGMALCTGE